MKKGKIMTKEEILFRMKNKKLYFESPELLEDKEFALENLADFNSTRPSEIHRREKLLHEMFAEVGEGCYLEPPLHANWGGKNVYLGNHVYANFNLTLVDDCDIRIGDNVMMGPNVTLDCGTHPISPSLRLKGAQYNLPITIEENVWIGANVIVLPGVTIHKNSVIGAGSVVTKDIPENVVAVGTPCHVQRKITENDELFYNKDMEIDIH
jgi:galactoside O-acetyltransferase